MKNLFLMISFVLILVNLPLTIQASEIIEIPDPNLKAAILKELVNSPIGDITKEQAENVKVLYLEKSQISSLEGLQYFTNIRTLSLGGNNIIDLSPLSSLKHIDELLLEENHISDVTPLSKMSSLVILNLIDNQINDVTPLSNLIGLGYLYLGNNYITDISPLASLTELAIFIYSGNSISDLSTIKNINRLSVGMVQEEEITLPSQTIQQGQSLTIVNPIKDRDGSVKDLSIQNGSYNADKNEITWENITENQTLTYTFSKRIEMPPGAILFEGTVSVPVIVESGEATTNDAPTIHAPNRVIEKGAKFNPLQNVTANDAKNSDLTSKIIVSKDNVDTNIPGSYEVTYEVSDETGATSTLTSKVEVREIPQTGRSLYKLK